ncbi:MAG TPA: hypothetical protein VGD71_26780 [Kribbella sp.]
MQTVPGEVRVAQCRATPEAAKHVSTGAAKAVRWVSGSPTAE